MRIVFLIKDITFNVTNSDTFLHNKFNAFLRDLTDRETRCLLKDKRSFQFINQLPADSERSISEKHVR